MTPLRDRKEAVLSTAASLLGLQMVKYFDEMVLLFHPTGNQLLSHLTSVIFLPSPAQVLYHTYVSSVYKVLTNAAKHRNF